jgi:hypothetical protein
MTTNSQGNTILIALDDFSSVQLLHSAFAEAPQNVNYKFALPAILHHCTITTVKPPHLISEEQQ